VDKIECKYRDSWIQLHPTNLFCWVGDFAKLVQILLFEFPWIWRVEKEVIKKPRSVDLFVGGLHVKPRGIPEKRRGTILGLKQGAQMPAHGQVCFE
jgi:hypothetical protein